MSMLIWLCWLYKYFEEDINNQLMMEKISVNLRGIEEKKKTLQKIPIIK